MRRLTFTSITIALIVLLSACGYNTVKASLNEEFTLAIGQTATIASENLRIRFVNVTGDSRCAKDVVCIWAGEVSCALEITQNGVTEQVILTQPGLSDAEAGQTIGTYTYRFSVEPYPESTKEIKKEDYRLKMTVSKGQS